MLQVMKSGALIAKSKPWGLIGSYNPSLMDALFPSINTVHRIAIALIMVGVLVACGRATFYLPDNPVPITFQTAGVLLMGGFLGLRWGLFGILVWYLLGMAGIPVFKDGGFDFGWPNGWNYVSGSPTAGYLIGFIGAASMIGYLSQRGWHHSNVLWPMLLANLFIYLPALLWLNFSDFGWPKDGELFKSGMYVYIPGDLVKLMLASMVIGLGWRISDRRGYRTWINARIYGYRTWINARIYGYRYWLANMRSPKSK